MAVPSYNHDLTDIDLAETTTGYSAYGGGGSGLGTGADFRADFRGDFRADFRGEQGQSHAGGAVNNAVLAYRNLIAKLPSGLRISSVQLNPFAKVTQYYSKAKVVVSETITKIKG